MPIEVPTEVLVQGLRDQLAKPGVDTSTARWLLVAATRLEALNDQLNPCKQYRKNYR